MAIIFATLFIFLLRLELVFAYATDGANPIIGDILKGCSWLDATIGISYCGIIDVTAYFANASHGDRHSVMKLHKLHNIIIKRVLISFRFLPVLFLMCFLPSRHGVFQWFAGHHGLELIRIRS